MTTPPPSSNDRSTGHGNVDAFFGALFGIVTIGVGVIKTRRGFGGPGSIEDRRDPE